MDIAATIERVMGIATRAEPASLDVVKEADREARRLAAEAIDNR